MENPEKARELFDRFQKGQCTPQEKAKLYAWFNHYAGHEAHGLDDLAQEFEDNSAAFTPKEATKYKISPRMIAIAATLLVFLLAGIAIFTYYKSPSTLHDGIAGKTMSEIEILPGTNKATLQLADGTKIDLNSEREGIVIQGDQISYGQGEEEILELKTINQLVLSTPNGGTYQLTLSDGTKVWMNAGSTLRYPSKFVGKERLVELSGEAYFDVATNKNMPFKILSAGQRIEVLGTELNVSAYADDEETKTTLVEGSIMLYGSMKQSVKIKPNQQAKVAGGKIELNDVDVKAAIAWKNGLFNFHGITIEESMRQLERWYDIRVVYRGDKPKGYLGGKMSRGVKLHNFLAFLERDFQIKSELRDDRTLILYNDKP